MNQTSIPLELALQAAGWIFALGVLLGGLGFRLGHHRMMRRFANDDAFALERRKYWQKCFPVKSAPHESNHEHDERDGP
jgi:hypothetical protein